MPPERGEQGFLAKLHGSIDWTLSHHRIYTGDPSYKGSLERHAVLYPGFKGRPAAEPFSLFHQHFLQCFRAASAVIVIGFAFRDEYINALLEAAECGSRLILIDPAASPNVPLRGFAPENHICEGFAPEAVSKMEKLLAKLPKR